jgi:hypothetical protein
MRRSPSRDDHGNPIIIQPQDIIPLAEKLKQRQQLIYNQQT